MVPGNYPSRILSRLVKQAPNVNRFQSCQAELIVNLPNGAAIHANSDTMVLQVSDAYHILPYTTLEFVWSIGVPTLSTPYSCPISVTQVMTEAQVAAATKLGIENWIALHEATFKVFREIKCESLDVGTDPKSKIYFPFGMLNSVVVSYFSTVAGASVTLGNSGVDNPILSGLWGPNKFAYPVQPRYNFPYYGEVPIG